MTYEKGKYQYNSILQPCVCTTIRISSKHLCIFACVRTFKGCATVVGLESVASTPLQPLYPVVGRSHLAHPLRTYKLAQQDRTDKKKQVLCNTPSRSEHAKGCANNRRHTHCARRSGSNITRPIAPPALQPSFDSPSSTYFC